ncbi:Exostosin family protein [Nonlabens sp. Hel1_33_55]|uniref:exostosin domain-containing protein n=1 Tax=Nonlabens sp. Hel1_33_55 TaxID=1336802 RepID=UPI000875E683|nr:exostosin family protein [Nonlabens sp. Hel1_33_55]SCX92726.1 Exostosin family protein [Nonlabens sp. Hel1_33_55]
MIRLFTFKDLLIPENRGSVHPLIFDLCYFENAHQKTHEQYSLVDDPNEADAFIFPMDLLSQRTSNLYAGEFNKMLSLTKKHNKKLWVYTGGDYGTTIRDPSVLTWRLSGNRFSNSDQTIIVPSFINDPIQHQKAHLSYLAYEEKPHIAFTGHATKDFFISTRFIAATFAANLKRSFKVDKSDIQPIFIASAERYRILKKLESSKNFKTNFIYRKKYRGGDISKEERLRGTQEFFANLTGSAYTFCMRGAGNFSVRFYESLACGRIPILIDTDVALPLENIIDWKKSICRIDPKKNIEEQILKFHKKLNPSSFLALQKSNRKLYKDYLVRHAFFEAVYNQLKQ